MLQLQFFLAAYNSGKKTPTKKAKVMSVPKNDIIKTKIVADNVYISDPCLQRKKKLVGFIPDPDKLENMAVSKDIFPEELLKTGHKEHKEKPLDANVKYKIEENEQFIIELLSKTQPHHDHGYTTIFGKRLNTEQVDILLDMADDEPEQILSWKDELKTLGMNKMIFIEPDTKKCGKKRPAPILFLRHR